MQDVHSKCNIIVIFIITSTNIIIIIMMIILILIIIIMIFSILIGVSIIFFLSWAPINCFNMVIDLLGIIQVNNNNDDDDNCDVREIFHKKKEDKPLQMLFLNGYFLFLQYEFYDIV